MLKFSLSQKLRLIIGHGEICRAVCGASSHRCPSLIITGFQLK
ncbi:MAG: hypothetical protein RLY17_1718, partial [Pseudomonadota bacterium]